MENWILFNIDEISREVVARKLIDLGIDECNMRKVIMPECAEGSFDSDEPIDILFIPEKYRSKARKIVYGLNLPKESCTIPFKEIAKCL